MMMALGVATLSLVSCSTIQTINNSGSEPLSQMSASDRAEAERVFSLANKERVKVGAKPLRGHPGLNILAQKHANYLSQNAKNGKASTFGSINRSRYAKLRYGIENVTELANSTSSEDVAAYAVNAWMASAEHRRTLLKSWNTTGIGVARGPYGRTYVSMLVGASNSQPIRTIPTGF